MACSAQVNDGKPPLRQRNHPIPEEQDIAPFIIRTSLDEKRQTGMQLPARGNDIGALPHTTGNTTHISGFP
ncbi:hypothetical protein HQS1_10250 [Delftia lacustris]|jgi:hypothetical protein|nr:hypothetical protein HQS1_10250 [Delftia lacustris]